MNVPVGYPTTEEAQTAMRDLFGLEQGEAWEALAVQGGMRERRLLH